MGVLVCLAVLNLLFAPFTLLMTKILSNTNMFPSWTLGFFQSTIACGSILGLIVLNFLRKKMSTLNVFKLSLVFKGVSMMFLLILPSIIVAITAPFCFGLVSGIISTISVSRLISEEYLSRYFSFLDVILKTALPIRIFITELFLEKISPETFLFIDGLCLILVSLLITSLPFFQNFLKDVKPSSDHTV